MTLSAALPFAIYLFGALLVGGAVMVFARGPERLASFGYPIASLPNLVAGRFIAIASMTSWMAYAAEWRGLAILLTCGGLLGLIDLFFVRQVGGPAWPHLVAVGICLLLAAGSYSLSRG